jgi:hypothetical protein
MCSAEQSALANICCGALSARLYVSSPNVPTAMELGINVRYWKLSGQFNIVCSLSDITHALHTAQIQTCSL